MDETSAIETTRRWVSAIVVGLNLCPFAGAVVAANRIRYAITAAADGEELRSALRVELLALAAAPRADVETTLLIHPLALLAFSEFNDFLAEADRLLGALRLRGVIQVVGFHPGYQFAGTTPDAVENYTNRSPHPMLHLLREESVTEIGGDAAALDLIPSRNCETLRRLGRAEILARLQRVADPSSE